MGSAASTVTSQTSSNLKISQMEDNILSSGESLSAFLKYLEKIGKGCILNWYLDIVEYRDVECQNVTIKAMEIRSRYEHMINKRNESTTLLAIWKSVDTTLPCNGDGSLWSQSTIRKRLDSAKFFTLSLLLKEIDGFYKSIFFTEYELTTSNSKYASKLLCEGFIRNFDTILVIDDSSVRTNKMATLLENDGHVVFRANHGRVGVHLATSNSISFGSILINMNMKTMDPLDVIKQIRACYNGTVHISKPLQFTLCLRKFNEKNTNLIVKQGTMDQDKSFIHTTDDYIDEVKRSEPVFVSLVENCPSYICNQSYFHGSINIESAPNTPSIPKRRSVDLSLSNLVSDLHLILEQKCHDDGDDLSECYSCPSSSVEEDFDICDSMRDIQISRVEIVK